MARRDNITQQLKDYRGVLHFAQVLDIASSTTHPAVTIPLFIKEHPIPIRKRKYQEVNTIPNIDPASQYETNVNIIFQAGFETLTIQLSGWIITPMTNKQWTPTVDGTKTGTSLNLTGVSYSDLISAYIEGRMNRSATGRWQRVDPDYYLDPYGNMFPNPKILVWEPQYTPTSKKQSFNLTLALES